MSSPVRDKTEKATRRSVRGMVNNYPINPVPANEWTITSVVNEVKAAMPGTPGMTISLAVQPVAARVLGVDIFQVFADTPLTEVQALRIRTRLIARVSA
jgi:hypothetical protein